MTETTNRPPSECPNCGTAIDMHQMVGVHFDPITGDVQCTACRFYIDGTWTPPECPDHFVGAETLRCTTCGWDDATHSYGPLEQAELGNLSDCQCGDCKHLRDLDTFAEQCRVNRIAREQAELEQVIAAEEALPVG